MKKRIKRLLIIFAMMFVLFAVSACGKDTSLETSSTETEEESTAESIQDSEEEIVENEETEPTQTTSGHQHNVDVEEKLQETDAEEKEQDEEETQEETTATEKKETEVPTSSAETTTAPTAESITAAPSTPDMSQLEEWMPPVNMLVVRDANVVDENGNVLGPIEKGSDIGVTGQCPGFYQVNYGAKRSFLPKDCLSSR